MKITGGYVKGRARDLDTGFRFRGQGFRIQVVGRMGSGFRVYGSCSVLRAWGQVLECTGFRIQEIDTGWNYLDP